MNRCARYAIYYAPRPDSELWRLASAWLGRDAHSDSNVARPEIPALRGCDLDRLTASPRHYGFHATLKAPFEPADESTEPALLAAVERFVVARAPFDVSLEVAELGDFIALRATRGGDALRALHEACVRELDEFRRPVDKADIRRRRQRRLGHDQDTYLLRWGYPYVFEHFRFHMTLTGRIASTPSRARIRDAIARTFAAAVAQPVPVDGVAVFGQTHREAPFRVLDRFQFGARLQSGPARPAALPRRFAARD